MSETKLLVLGAPRSGTSLLAGMIGAHPNVAMLREEYAGSMGKIVGKEVVANKLCIPNQIGFSHTWWNRLLRRYGYTFFRGYSVVSIEDYMSDPRMRVVGVVRSPYAVVESMIRRGGLRKHAAYARWAKGTEMLTELSQRYQDRVLILSFERLVQEPQTVMSSVCDHLSLEYSDAMMLGHRHTASYDSENSTIDPGKAEVSSGLIEKHPLHVDYRDEFELYRSLKNGDRQRESKG